MNFRFTSVWLGNVLLALSISCFAQKADKGAAVMFQADAQHTSQYDSPRFNHFEKVKWKVKTQGKIFSSPAIRNGVAYVGSNDKHLYAIDVQSGKTRWTYPTQAAILSSPAVFRDIVYINSSDGTLHALDAKTGKKKWIFDKPGEEKFNQYALPWGGTAPDIWDIYTSSPTIDQKAGVLYFGCGDHLYALDADTGQQKWSFPGKIIHSTAALGYGMVYIGTFGQFFYALDAQTGKVSWEYKQNIDPINEFWRLGFQPAALVHDGKVYFGSREASFLALNAFTGQPVWQQPYDARGSWILSSAGVSKGTVYFGTSDGYSLVGLDAKTGKEQFEFDAETYVYSSPAIAGGVAYFGNYTGKLYALDLKSNGKRWAEFELDARKTSTARIFNEKGRIDWQNVILKDKESSLENELWGLQQIHSYGSIACSPVIDKGVIYFGSTDSTFYAISLAKNKAPQVSLTAPHNQANFAAGTPITLSAEARDRKDQIRKVEFFARSASDRWVKIGEATQYPYQINWTGATEGQYFIKAQAMDRNGGFAATDPIEVSVSTQAVTPNAAARMENAEVIQVEKGEPELISFPNPFNAQVKISFALPQDGSTLLILQGRLGTAAVLVNQHLKAGSYTVEYDGSRLAPDLYIAQLTTGNKVVVKKMLKP